MLSCSLYYTCTVGFFLLYKLKWIKVFLNTFLCLFVHKVAGFPKSYTLQIIPLFFPGVDMPPIMLSICSLKGTTDFRRSVNVIVCCCLENKLYFFLSFFLSVFLSFFHFIRCTLEERNYSLYEGSFRCFLSGVDKVGPIRFSPSCGA